MLLHLKLSMFATFVTTHIPDQAEILASFNPEVDGHGRTTALTLTLNLQGNSLLLR
jgi:hypothetical protein